MPHVLGIDHVAFAAADLEATCAFYDRLFGARTHLDYAPEGRSLVRQIALGSRRWRPCSSPIPPGAHSAWWPGSWQPGRASEGRVLPRHAAYR